MPDSKISALPSGIPAQAGDQFPIARSGLNYSLTPVTLASGFTNLGAWQSVRTSNFTAAVGKAYPINTTSAAITVTLPVSATQGDVIYLADYAGTFATNNLTIDPNFGTKLNGSWSVGVVSTNRAALQLVYSDATQGWLCYTDTIANLFTSLFTINGLVVAGGGGTDFSGGGGFRTYQALYPSSPSPGTIETGTVTIGAAGSGLGNGGNSVLNTITSYGGGYGGLSGPNGSPGNPGGSGGGGGYFSGGGAGNTPAFSPSQGNPGGGGNYPSFAFGGGGGAGSSGGAGVAGRGAASGLLGTFSSTTSNTLGTGSKTFTVPTGLSNLNAGEGIRAAIDASNYMDCQITSYNSGTGALVINANQANFVVGSGTSTSWTFTRLYACGRVYDNANSSFSAVNTGAGSFSGVVLISIPNTGSVTFSAGVTSTMTTVGANKVYKVTATSTTSETYTVTVP